MPSAKKMSKWRRPKRASVALLFGTWAADPSWRQVALLKPVSAPSPKDGCAVKSKFASFQLEGLTVSSQPIA